MNKFEEILKKLLENDVCYLYENGKFKYKIKSDYFQNDGFCRNYCLNYITYREYECPFTFHMLDESDLNRFEILTKEEVNQKYGDCTMNKFQENIKKFEDLKNSNKLAYLKFENTLVKVDEIEKHFGSVVFKRVVGFACVNYRLLNTNDFQILNEEEFLKENVKKIENRLKEIEEEKKPKIEIGKTYVTRSRKYGNYTLVHVTDHKEEYEFWCQNGVFRTIVDFSKCDFQEVDISIKEFFENMPQKYWKN